MCHAWNTGECVRGFGGSAGNIDLQRRPRFMWVCNIEIDLMYERVGGMDWIHLAQDRGQLHLL
jgi:hypothetical protein